MKKIIGLMIGALFILGSFCSCQEKGKNEKVFERTKEFVKFNEAIASVNKVIEANQEKNDFPEDVRIKAEAVYYDYIDAMTKSAQSNEGRVNTKTFEDYILQLELHPQAASERIFIIVENIFENKLDALAVARYKCTNVNQEKWNIINSKIEYLYKKQNELFDVLTGRITVDEVKLGLPKNASLLPDDNLELTKKKSDRSISDLANYFAKCGYFEDVELNTYSTGRSRFDFGRDFGTAESATIYICFDPIAVYKYDLNDEGQKSILKKAEKQKTISYLGVELPCLVNSPFLILGYQDTEEKEKIKKAFSEF